MLKSFTFTATQDMVDDDGEGVKVAFGTPLPTGVSMGAPTTVSIDDDDGAGVSVSEAALTIGEGSSGTYTIVLDSQPTADVTVTINDPSVNTDVTADPASLTFSSSDWSATQTVTVNAAQDDDAADDMATVTHTVTSADSSYNGASASSVIVTVTDDEVTVMFGAGTYMVAEGGTVEVAVTLSANPERTVVIPITAMNQGGADTGDYSVPPSVTFDADDTLKMITFSATDDTDDDDGESVLLGFGTALPGGVSAGTPATTMVSIINDDSQTVSFGAGTSTVLGGGGGGGGGPSPSVIDFEWTVERDIAELGSGHDTPSGVWSDGATLWVLENGDGADDAVYAYDVKTGERLEDREFALDGTNRAPRGVWSDGETMWVSDSGRNRLFSHDLRTGEHLPAHDVALAERNRDARGIWSGEETMWVLDGGKDSIFTYDLASSELVAEYALDDANGDPHGVWSDGTTVWVSDHGAKRLFAYRLPARPEAPAAEDAEPQALERVRDEEFTELSKASNNSPRGLWSDGDLMYVADASDARVYSYNMPDAFDARLASLSLSDVDIGDFSGLKTEYTGIPEDDATETTVAAVAVQDEATIVIAPDDADGNARDGHEVTLDGAAVTVTVTSPDGSRTRVYRVQFEPADVAPASVADDPWETCLRGMTEGRFSLVAYEGGTIDDLRSCASRFELLAIWSDPDRVWVPIIFGAPDYVNVGFERVFPTGIPPVTPFVAQRNLPRPPAPVRETAEPDKTADSTDAAPPQTEAPTPAGEESTPVIGNTGGDGVSHRYDCDDAARGAAIGRWSDGTEIEVLGEGRGRCAGWLLAEAEDVTSWVREQYVVGFTATPADPAQELSLEIGNTGGDGVSHRNECADEARLSAIGGWSDNTAVEVLADGLGRCAGWLWVEADADGVTSWVREEYLIVLTTHLRDT